MIKPLIVIKIKDPAEEQLSDKDLQRIKIIMDKHKVCVKLALEKSSLYSVS